MKTCNLLRQRHNKTSVLLHTNKVAQWCRTVTEKLKMKRSEKTATCAAFSDALVGITTGFTHSQEPPVGADNTNL